MKTIPRTMTTKRKTMKISVFDVDLNLLDEREDFIQIYMLFK